MRSLLDAVAGLDALRARARFGKAVGGTIPRVADGAELAVTNARHALLALRNDGVVGNDARLGPGGARCLVISGANAGGKSVLLKTLGLVAVLARLGAPVPCDEGAVVGCFDPILADIGDAQNADGNVSTYVGHLLVAKAALEAADADRAERPLVLLDELGSGTDAAQGGALAQAVLEDLVEKDAVLVCTTHSQSLKFLAAGDDDDRFLSVAMAPGFTAVAGRVGESRALDIARDRVRLPDRVVDRAELLLGDSQRKLADLARDLDAAREAADATAADARREAAAAAAARADADAEAAALRAATLRAEETAARDYGDRLAALEDRLRAAEAAAALDAKLAAALEDERAAAAAAAAAKNVERRGLAPLASADAVAVGDAVVVIRAGVWYAKPARVTALLPKKGVLVAVDGVDAAVGGDLKVKLKELSLPPAGAEAAAPAKKPKPRGKKVPKQLVGLDGPEPAAAAAPPKGDANVRGDFNTLDCRGMRYDDAERETDYFLDRMLRQGASSAFVLHGHGTGALKKGLRSYLATHPLAKQAKPAAHDDGGDAFTRVVLRAAKRVS